MARTNPRRSPRLPPSTRIAGLPAPLSELPWSASFVMQAIELLPVMRRDGQLLALRPDCADSFVVGWPARARPEVVATAALARLGFDPIVLHSTSWRHDGAEVVLTYLAVVAPLAAPPASWAVGPVARSDLARGDATRPPDAIDTGQVLEHALRHLAWLTRDDPVVARELADWGDLLDGYVPEPFRAFGTPLPGGPT